MTLITVKLLPNIAVSEETTTKVDALADNASDAQNRLSEIRETEQNTKMAYVVVAGLFAADAAGVFAAGVPQEVFAVALIGLLLVDAATPS